MSSRMSNLTFRRALNLLRYNYQNTCRKWMLQKKSHKSETYLVCQDNPTQHAIAYLWCTEIFMYVDGVKFEHKSNPINPNKCAKSLTKKERWPIREGVHFCRTARQSKEKKNYVKLFVSVAYNRRVVMRIRIQ